MDEQTRKLLEECTSGCKMAVSSIQQILEFTQDSALQKILNKYIEQHTHLQQTAESQLSADGFVAKRSGNACFSIFLVYNRNQAGHELVIILRLPRF